MIPYKNLGGDSNITHYENGDGYIKVHFRKGYWKLYTYTHMSAGSSVIQHMQNLAEQGQGLNSYISRNKPSYASKC
jgi:hypothetical protein